MQKPMQDFFVQFNVPFKISSLIETSLIDRWGETGVPRVNHLTQAELVLSHIWPVRGSTYTRYCGFVFFWIQFKVPFKIISLIETSQSIGGRNGSTPGKPPDTPASRTYLVSHMASAGLEPTPGTAVR